MCTYHSKLIVAPLFKNSSNKIPSLFKQMLAMTLPTEFCTLNLFFFIFPPVLI
jgi:hypothetical protein